MHDASTPLRPLYRGARRLHEDNNIRRRVIRANPLPLEHRTPRKKAADESQPVRLMDNSNIFAQHAPQIARNNHPPAKQLPPIALSAETIKSSEQYCQLLLEMDRITERHEQEMRELRQDQEQAESQLSANQSDVYELKMAIWQLKNNIMEYRGAVEQEEHHYSLFFQRLQLVEQQEESEENASDNPQNQYDQRYEQQANLSQQLPEENLSELSRP